MFLINNYKVVNGFLIKSEGEQVFLKNEKEIKLLAKCIFPEEYKKFSFNQKINLIYKLSGHHSQHVVSKKRKTLNNIDFEKYCLNKFSKLDKKNEKSQISFEISFAGHFFTTNKYIEEFIIKRALKDKRDIIYLRNKNDIPKFNGEINFYNYLIVINEKSDISNHELENIFNQYGGLGLSLLITIKDKFNKKVLEQNIYTIIS